MPEEQTQTTTNAQARRTENLEQFVISLNSQLEPELLQEDWLLELKRLTLRLNTFLASNNISNEFLARDEYSSLIRKTNAALNTRNIDSNNDVFINTYGPNLRILPLDTPNTINQSADRIPTILSNFLELSPINILEGLNSEDQATRAKFEGIKQSIERRATAGEEKFVSLNQEINQRLIAQEGTDTNIEPEETPSEEADETYKQTEAQTNLQRSRAREDKENSKFLESYAKEYRDYARDRARNTSVNDLLFKRKEGLAAPDMSKLSWYEKRAYFAYTSGRKYIHNRKVNAILQRLIKENGNVGGIVTERLKQRLADRMGARPGEERGAVKRKVGDFTRDKIAKLIERNASEESRIRKSIARNLREKSLKRKSKERLLKPFKVVGAAVTGRLRKIGQRIDKIVGYSKATAAAGKFVRNAKVPFQRAGRAIRTGAKIAGAAGRTLRFGAFVSAPIAIASALGLATVSTPAIVAIGATSGAFYGAKQYLDFIYNADLSDVSKLKKMAPWKFKIALMNPKNMARIQALKIGALADLDPNKLKLIENISTELKGISKFKLALTNRFKFVNALDTNIPGRVPNLELARKASGGLAWGGLALSLSLSLGLSAPAAVAIGAGVTVTNVGFQYLRQSMSILQGNKSLLANLANFPGLGVVDVVHGSAGLAYDIKMIEEQGMDKFLEYQQSSILGAVNPNFVVKNWVTTALKYVGWITGSTQLVGWGAGLLASSATTTAIGIGSVAAIAAPLLYSAVALAFPGLGLAITPGILIGMSIAGITASIVGVAVGTLTFGVGGIAAGAATFTALSVPAYRFGEWLDRKIFDPFVAGRGLTNLLTGGFGLYSLIKAIYDFLNKQAVSITQMVELSISLVIVLVTTLPLLITISRSTNQAAPEIQQEQDFISSVSFNSPEFFLDTSPDEIAQLGNEKAPEVALENTVIIDCNNITDETIKAPQILEINEVLTYQTPSGNQLVDLKVSSSDSSNNFIFRNIQQLEENLKSGDILGENDVIGGCSS